MADKLFRFNRTTGQYEEYDPITSSAGAGDAGKVPATDAAGKLALSLMPAGVGAQVKQLTASEALAAGDFVNVWDDAGTLKVRKADASAAGKPAHGFVLEAVGSGATGTVYLSGTNNQLAGLTGGPRMFLSPTTPGAATATVPSTAGQVAQCLGERLSATEIAFRPEPAVTLA